jgi:hypothetical protein
MADRYLHVLGGVGSGVMIVVGIILIYGACFLYEDEEKALQNALTDWWIRIDDRRLRGTSKRVQFVRQVAHRVCARYDRVFGRNLLSVRAFSVGLNCSAGSIFILAAMRPSLQYYLAQEANDPVASRAALVNLVVTLPTFVLIAILLFLLRDSKILFSLVYIPWSFLVIIASTQFDLREERVLSIMVSSWAGLSLGIVCDLVYIVVLRWVTRRLRWSKHFLAMVLLTVLSTAIGLLLAVGPLVFPVSQGGLGHLLMESASTSAPRTVFILFLACSNLLVFLASVWLLFTAALMLFHRLFWPTLSRPLYALARVGVFRHRKTIFIAGLGLLLLPLVGPSSPLIQVLLECCL